MQEALFDLGNIICVDVEGFGVKVFITFIVVLLSFADSSSMHFTLKYSGDVSYVCKTKAESQQMNPLARFQLVEHHHHPPAHQVADRHLLP